MGIGRYGQVCGAVLSLGVLGSGVFQASAQSLPILEDCIAGNGVATPTLTAEACSQQLYNACIDLKGSETTPDIGACMQEGGALWDQLLNQLWPQMKARAEAMEILDSQLKTQRAWIAYRDARCQQEYDEYAGGTMRSIAPVACVRDMTAERAMEFYRTLSQ